MIDTHAHLNFKAFEGEVGAVLGRAEEVGVKKFIVPGSDLETSKRAVDLARKYPEIFASVSIHPFHAKEMSIEVLEQFFVLVAKEKVVAVGETGLDYYRLDKTSKFADYPRQEEQKIVFVQMLKLAQDAKKPLILHCRDAYKEMLEILISEGIKIPGVIHCFSGTKDEAKEFLDLGFYISFSGNITYSDSLVDLVKSVPLEKLLLETDSPYLAPEPYRGKRNEPAYMLEIAKKIAEIKGISLVEVEKKTTENAEKLFKI